MSLPITNYELLICNNHVDYLLAKNQEANMTSILFLCFFVISNTFVYCIGNKIINNYINKIYYYNILLTDLNDRYDLELDLTNIKDCYIEYHTRPELSEEEDGSDEETSNDEDDTSDSLTIKGKDWKLD